MGKNQLYVSHVEGVFDDDSVWALIRARRVVVAKVFGLGIKDLKSRSHQHNEVLARRLAVALCIRVPGSNPVRLARVFGIQPSYIGQQCAFLARMLEESPADRALADAVCSKLGVPVPGSAGEGAWPEASIQLVWETMAARLGCIVERIRQSPTRSFPIHRRNLAIDICLRFPPMEAIRAGFSQKYDWNAKLIARARRQTPAALRSSSELRAVDRDVSRAVGVPFRKESREV